MKPLRAAGGKVPTADIKPSKKDHVSPGGFEEQPQRTQLRTLFQVVDLYILRMTSQYKDSVF